MIIKYLKHIKDQDPAKPSYLEIILLYPCVNAIISHKFSKFFYQIRLKFIARLISQISRLMTGIEIHPGATIGKYLFIDHGMGVVIGETAKIGDYCTIYHGVTLGGNGKKSNKHYRHPQVGNNVIIGANACLLGPIIVSDNAKIGAGAIVTCDVKENTTFIGYKAHNKLHYK